MHMTQLWCLQPWLDSGRTRSRIVTTDIVVMKLGSALDFKFVACCYSRRTARLAVNDELMV